ncbi:glycosyltransferase [Mesorhizobium salmacidum]|uniref:Glycosyltransferase n=1 Tax=Mesorhizobium salmacidum TaxID=3015171 RepID=A0ABU8L5S1_9HYPH
MRREPLVPLVSVLIPSYNHGDFIVAAVDSVLAQTYGNIQVIIVDDASSDKSVEVIQSLRDERIVCRFLESNVGACQAMNIGLSMCEGPYIAVCNSDDIWVPTKLEQQLEKFKNCQNLGAVFSDVEWIDSEGRFLSEENAPPFESVFKRPNRSRFSWIRDLIEGGNCLCHPSVLIKREVYQTVGTYNNFYRQLPDLDMWLRVLQHYEILVMPEKLVGFRLHEGNTSRPGPITSTRSINEHRLILVNMMKEITADNFFGAFGFTNVLSIGDPSALKFEIARYLLDYRGGVYENMFNQLGTEVLLEIPQHDIIQRGISAHHFHERVGRNTPWISYPSPSPPPEKEIHSEIEAPPFDQGPLIAETKTVDLIRTVAIRIKARLRERLMAIASSVRR